MTAQPKKPGRQSLQDFLDGADRNGWVVTDWEADIQYFRPLGHGKLTISLSLPRKPKPFARKLRRYDVRTVLARNYDRAAGATDEGYGYCEQCNDYHDAGY